MMIVGIGLVVLGAALMAWGVRKWYVLPFIAGGAIAIIGGCIFAGQLLWRLL